MKISRLLALSITLTAPLIFTSCKSNDAGHGTHSGHSPEPVQVSVSEVYLQEVPIYNEVIGIIRSRFRASVAPKVTGEILKIHVSPGKSVSKGDLLVELSAMEFSTKLQQAQAALDKVRRDLQREEKLLIDQSSTQIAVEDLKDQERLTKAIVAEAQTFLSYTKIHAPFDGVITRKFGNEGDLGLPGTPVLEIEDFDHLRVEADIPEALANFLEVKSNIKVVLPDGKIEDASVEEIAPSADPKSRTFPVKIGFSNTHDLKSGQSVKIQIPVKKAEVLLVPRSAISHWGQIERVFVLDEGYIHMRIVKTGDVYGDSVEILSGLTAGEEIALHDGGELIDGAPIAK